MIPTQVMGKNFQVIDEICFDPKTGVIPIKQNKMDK